MMSYWLDIGRALVNYSTKHISQQNQGFPKVSSNQLINQSHK